jgi:hypothetical protein
VESVVSKIQETGQHAAKKTDVLFGRTRNAGAAFVEEVIGAGRDLAAFVRVEGKGWKRFLTARAASIQSEARGLLTVPAIERELLTRVNGTLRVIDAKVRSRLIELEKREEKPAPRRRATANGANGKKAPPARKGKSASGHKTSAASAIAGAPLRH